MNVKPGDVFCIDFPFKDDIFQSKSRPVVVLRDEGNGLVLLAPVTGTDHRDKRDCLWIQKKSNDGKMMSLTKDSFIVVDNSLKYPAFGLRDYRGSCSNELLASLLKLL